MSFHEKRCDCNSCFKSSRVSHQKGTPPVDLRVPLVILYYTYCKSNSCSSIWKGQISRVKDMNHILKLGLPNHQSGDFSWPKFKTQKFWPDHLKVFPLQLFLKPSLQLVSMQAGLPQHLSPSQPTPGYPAAWAVSVAVYICCSAHHIISLLLSPTVAFL